MPIQLPMNRLACVAMTQSGGDACNAPSAYGSPTLRSDFDPACTA